MMQDLTQISAAIAINAAISTLFGRVVWRRSVRIRARRARDMVDYSQGDL